MGLTEERLVHDDASRPAVLKLNRAVDGSIRSWSMSRGGALSEAQPVRTG